MSHASGIFTYTRRNPALRNTGLTYSYQYSTDLAASSWLPFTPKTDPPATDSGDPVETVTVAVPDVLLAKPRLFVRVVSQ